MEPTALRRTLALIFSASVIASLAVAAAAVPAAAQPPTCDGRIATITDNDGTDQDPDVGVIVGTQGPDVIVGTSGDDAISGLAGRDRICGGTGNDSLFGDIGNDRLFGGSGNDSIEGGTGDDDLFGFAGNDFLDGGPGRDFLKGGDGRDNLFGSDQADILQGNGGSDLLRGQGGNDSLDGGAAADDCTQGAGSGPIRNCERADLSVRVLGPTLTDLEPEEVATFRIRVVNNGPDATGYELMLSVIDDGGTCSGQESWVGTSRKALLKAGTSRVDRVEMKCGTALDESTIEARVDADARDPKPANNKASLTTVWD